MDSLLRGVQTKSNENDQIPQNNQSRRGAVLRSKRFDCFNSLRFQSSERLLYLRLSCAGVAELVDAPDSKSGSFHGSAGSIPALGTNSLFHYCFSPIDTVPLSLVGLFPDRSPDKFYGPGENIGGGRRKLMLSMSSTRVCTREGNFKEVLCVVFT